MDEFLLKLLLCKGWEPGVCEGRVALDGGLQAGLYPLEGAATPRLHQKLSLPARGWDTTGVQPPVLLHLNSPQLSSRALSFLACLGCSDKETSDVFLVHAPFRKTGNHRRAIHKRMCHHFQPD